MHQVGFLLGLRPEPAAHPLAALNIPSIDDMFHSYYKP